MGSLSVSSVVGKGSIFEIQLKDISISTLQETDVPKQTQTVPDLHFKSATILVVDDVESNRKLITENLASTALTVLTAQNGQEALDIAKSHPLALIFMDLKMPVMDGYETTQLMKSDDTLKTIPIIALSASTSKTEQELMEGYGFTRYIKKPISRHQLFDTLSHFLDYDQTDTPDSEEPLQINTETLPSEVLIRLPEVLHKLEIELMPLWENLQETQPVKEIKHFGQEMQTIGETYSIPLCTTFGEDLIGYIDRFDISNMLTTLQQFPELIKKLRAIRG